MLENKNKYELRGLKVINKALVGYSGFVGSNLAMQYEFDGLYNSKMLSKHLVKIQICLFMLE